MMIAPTPARMPNSEPPFTAAPPMSPMPQSPPPNWNPATGPIQVQQLQNMPMSSVGMGMAAPPQPIRLAGPTDPRLVLLNEPDTDRAASYRLLRDTLLARRMPRVVAITSASRKEGKTSCACNLALALGERGARTILFDGNLWDPQLHQIFSLAAAPPSAMNAEWLAPYKITELTRNLHVAGVVVPPGQPVPRFEKTWFETLIGSLYRINYDFILIDCPALSVSPLASQLVGIAEGVLMAVRSGITTARSLRRAAGQLAPGKGLGLALIDTSPQR